MMLEPLGEVGANFYLQLSSRTQFTKINNKKVIAKNQCEKHKKSSLISIDYELPKIPPRNESVVCNFLKQNYIGHIMKCVSFSADEALPCNSQIHFVTIK